MSPDLKIQRSVVSRISFPNKSDLERIRTHMRSVRGTGKLVISFSQGGVNSITFEVSNSLKGHDNVELLFPDKLPAEDQFES